METVGAEAERHSWRERAREREREVGERGARGKLGAKARRRAGERESQARC